MKVTGKMVRGMEKELVKNQMGVFMKVILNMISIMGKELINL